MYTGQYVQLYILLRFPFKKAGQFDIEQGWSLDERNWAVLTATENTVETAEQVATAAMASVQVHLTCATPPLPPLMRTDGWRSKAL